MRARVCAPPPSHAKIRYPHMIFRVFSETSLSLSLLPLRAPKNTILHHIPPSPAQPPGRILVLIAVIAGTIVGLATALLMFNRGNNDDHNINSTEIGTEGRIGSEDGGGGGGGVVAVRFRPFAMDIHVSSSTTSSADDDKSKGMDPEALRTVTIDHLYGGLEEEYSDALRGWN